MLIESTTVGSLFSVISTGIISAFHFQPAAKIFFLEESEPSCARGYIPLARILGCFTHAVGIIFVDKTLLTESASRW
jgi:hypothetical protein